MGPVPENLQQLPYQEVLASTYTTTCRYSGSSAAILIKPIRLTDIFSYVQLEVRLRLPMDDQTWRGGEGLGAQWFT